jgi:hypothetical protein
VMSHKRGEARVAIESSYLGEVHRTRPGRARGRPASLTQGRPVFEVAKMSRAETGNYSLTRCLKTLDSAGTERDRTSRSMSGFA